MHTYMVNDTVRSELRGCLHRETGSHLSAWLDRKVTPDMNWQQRLSPRHTFSPGYSRSFERQVYPQMQKRSIAGITVLELRGDMDADAAECLAAWFEREVAPGQSRVVVNLSAVTFVDINVVGVLFKGMECCRQFGGDLHLCKLPLSVQMMLELTYVSQDFEVFPTEAEAILSAW